MFQTTNQQKIEACINFGDYDGENFASTWDHSTR